MNEQFNDYIYLTYKGYVIGNDYDNLIHSDVKLKDAYSVFRDKRKEISDAFENAGDKALAKEIQDMLNFTTYQDKQAEQALSQAKKEVLSQLNLTKEIEKELENKLEVSKNLNIHSTAEALGVLEQATNIKNKLEKQALEKEETLQTLEELLQLGKNAQKTIETLLNQSPTKVVGVGSLTAQRLADTNLAVEALQKRANGELDKWLSGMDKTTQGKVRQFLKKINNPISKKGKTGSSLLTSIRALYNSLFTVPSWNIGEVGEIAFAKIVLAGFGIANQTLQDVKIGSEKGAKLKITTSLTNKELQQAKKDNKILEYNGTTYVETDMKTQDKVDIKIKLPLPNDEEHIANVSVKNYQNNSDIKILSRGVLEDLLAAENQEHFVEHYINIMEIKQNPSPEDQKKISPYKKEAENTMNQLMFAKALAGYNLIKGYNGAIKQADMVNYMAINIKDGDSGRWVVETVKDAYIKGLSNTNYIIKNSEHSKNTTNPFEGDKQERVKKFESDEQKINARIASTLAFIHKSRIDVWLKSQALKDKK